MHRTAVAVVAGIIDVLQVERAIHASPDVDRVKHLENVFAAIVQMAIAQQKTLSTQAPGKGDGPQKVRSKRMQHQRDQSRRHFSRSQLSERHKPG